MSVIKVKLLVLVILTEQLVGIGPTIADVDSAVNINRVKRIIKYMIVVGL